MRAKQIADTPKTWALIFETGDELARGLKQFAGEAKLAAASFKAIGALSSVRLGWFDWETKEYQTSVDLEEQVELVSMVGDVALEDGQRQVHAHIVVARKDGSALGGHLQQAMVRPTCEVIVTESPKHLEKQFDPESGLALIAV